MSTRSLSYFPREMQIKTEGSVQFLFEALFCSLPLYFALKGKHDYLMANEAEFISKVKAKVAEAAAGFDLVAFPESRFPFMRQITEGLPHCVELRKRSKADICALALETPGWKKQDRLSAEKAWSEMGGTFTINTIKANQRRYYVSYLFEPLDIPSGSRVLIVDDFIMSGRTIEAMAAAIGVTDYASFGVFYQAPLESAPQQSEACPPLTMNKSKQDLPTLSGDSSPCA